MVDRIKEIASFFGLSTTAFADRIEVARPIISHIFSERNRPSLEVIQKIGVAFPEVDLNWLLYGSGDMLKKNANPGSIDQNLASQFTKESLVQAVDEKASLNNFNTIKAETPPEENALDYPLRKIKKVLIFYNDGTFEEFIPTV